MQNFDVIISGAGPVELLVPCSLHAAGEKCFCLTKPDFRGIIEQKFKARFENAKQITPIVQWGVNVLGGKQKWSGSGFVLIGDAGTFAMAFSGEGVGPAMLSGKIAAKAIDSALNRNDVSAASLHEFDKEMWKILQPEVKGFRWLEFLILHEAVFNWVAKKVAKDKELIEISSKMQGDYTAARQLASFKTIWKLLTS